jgi:hypothetical protein
MLKIFCRQQAAILKTMACTDDARSTSTAAHGPNKTVAMAAPNR